MSKKRLTRSRNQVIAGVCGGIAEYLGWQPDGVRVLWVVATVLSAGIGGVIVYVVLALVLPRAGGD